MCPYLARQLSGFSTAGGKFLSIVCRARMVSTRDNKIYIGSGLRGVIPYVQCRAVVFSVLGPFVVGVTNWSGEGVEPKSLRMGVRFIG
jgi:hypothetical protein